MAITSSPKDDLVSEPLLDPAADAVACDDKGEERIAYLSVLEIGVTLEDLRATEDTNDAEGEAASASHILGQLEQLEAALAIIDEIADLLVELDECAELLADAQKELNSESDGDEPDSDASSEDDVASNDSGTEPSESVREEFRGAGLTERMTGDASGTPSAYEVEAMELPRGKFHPVPKTGLDVLAAK